MDDQLHANPVPAISDLSARLDGLLEKCRAETRAKYAFLGPVMSTRIADNTVRLLATDLLASLRQPPLTRHGAYRHGTRHAPRGR